jgi:hypothetical protein
VGFLPPRHGFMECCRMVPSRMSGRCLLQEGAERDVLPPRNGFLGCCRMVPSRTFCSCFCGMMLSMMSFRREITPGMPQDCAQPEVLLRVAAGWC